MQQKIINTATDLYTRYGIKIMTMDEIASVCGISKKTLYTYFRSKYELVEFVVFDLFNKLKLDCFKVSAQAGNALDQAMDSVEKLEAYYQLIDSRVLEELKKYYHEIWDKLVESRKQEGLDLILSNLVRGQKEGLYHTEFDNQLLAEMRLAQLSFLHQNAGRQDFHKMFRQTTLHYLMGVCSPAGQAELKKYMNNYN